MKLNRPDKPDRRDRPDRSITLEVRRPPNFIFV